MSLEHNDKIEWVDPNVLTQHPDNNNIHTEAQINRLAEIIAYQGMRSPIIVNKANGHIVKGNATVKACIRNGLSKVPVIFQEYEDEQQEYAHLTSDNEIARWASLDLEKLKIRHKELDLTNIFNLDLYGLQAFEIEQEDDQDDSRADDIPDTDDNEFGVELGDIYQLGEHRLMCGDSTDEDTVSKLMNGQKVDMVFTDPPYGINYDDSIGVNTRAGKMKNSNLGSIMNDDKDDFFKKIFNKEIDFQFWWGGNYYCQDLPKGGAFSVWSKKTEAQSKVKALFNSDFELCWTNKDRRKKLFSIPWTGCMNKEKGEKRLHPTQKPIALVECYFDEWGKDKKIVLDYFLGSGSTLIACEKTKRKCYGMELDPHYCSVIIKRWQDYTGKKAEKLNG